VPTFVPGGRPTNVPFPSRTPRPQNGQGGDTPITLDLSGHGMIETCAAAGHGQVSFDLRGDGVRRRSDWVGGGTALLALDLDGDGRITSGRELFGSGTRIGGRSAVDGYEALAAYDADGDGAITPHDPIYADLLVWTDSDCDGMSQPQELRSIARAGIASLSLTVSFPADVHELVAGPQSAATMTSRFQRIDGTTGLMADIVFVSEEGMVSK
jgi:hypothetical protein